MELSVFDLFRIGPSSSHTVGPMRAAKFLCAKLRKRGLRDQVSRVRVELFGSLASTGRGHRTDRAIVWGLLGQEPETIPVEAQEDLWEQVRDSGKLLLDGERSIAFSIDHDLVFKPDEVLPYHPNGMRFSVFAAGEEPLYVKEFYSIGGGFVVGRKTAEADTLIK